MTGASSLEAASWSRLTFFDGFLGGLRRCRLLRVGIPFFLGVLDDVLHAAALGGIEVVQLVDDRLFGGDHRRDFQLGDALDVVNGQHVQRVGHRQEQFVFQPRDRHDLVVVRALRAATKFGHFDGDADAGEVDGRRVQHAAHGNGHVLLADVGLFEDEFEQARAVFLLLFQQFLHLLGRQQAVLDQGVGDAFSK